MEEGRFDPLTGMTDITLFMPTWNRRQLARIALRSLLDHTDWDRVRELLIVDCSSDDGLESDLQFLSEGDRTWPIRVMTIPTRHVVAAMVAARDSVTTPYIAKVDSDTIVPPGWLERLASVMDRNPDLWALGMEQRTDLTRSEPGDCGYLPAPFIGGIGLFRREAFDGLAQTESKYFGWNEHQADRPWKKGWVRPSLPVFLLDFLPFEPFKTLQTLYFQKGWHRSRGAYLETQEDLWTWKFPQWRSSRQADVLLLSDGDAAAGLEIHEVDGLVVFDSPEGGRRAMAKTEVKEILRQDPMPGARLPDPDRKALAGWLAYGVDLRRDAISGTWSFEGDALRGVAPDFTLHPGADHGRLLLPGTVPEEYDLSATVTRTEGAEDLGFGLVAAGRQVVFDFDSWGHWTGLFVVDGKAPPDSRLGLDGPILRNGEPRRIELQVRRNSFVVLLDGIPIWSWTPDWQRVSCNSYHGVDRPGTLFLVIYRSTYLVADLRLSEPKREPEA